MVVTLREQSSDLGSGRRTTGTVVGAMCVVVLMLTMPATVAAASTGVEAGEAEAIKVLLRAAQAPDRVAYRGVEFVSGWDGVATTSHVVDISHDPAAGTSLRVRGSGQAGSDGMRMDERRRSTDALPLLARSYRLSIAGSASVAGRRTTVVEAVADSGAGGRFWVDRASGLLLRRESYDRKGNVTRAAAFVDIRIGGVSPLRPAPSRLAAQPVTRWSPVDAASVRAAGWQCPASRMGGLQLVEARTTATTTGQAMHLVFADGLSRMSIFQQRGRLGTNGPAGFTADRAGRWVAPGYPRRVVWTGGGAVFTLVAEAPAETVDAVLAALPRSAPTRPPSGVTDRVERGMDRVASWFNLTS